MNKLKQVSTSFSKGKADNGDINEIIFITFIAAQQ